jgi:hypothetical protein
MITHMLAKLGHQLELSTVFFLKNLTLLVGEAWFRNFICIPVAI